MLFAAHLPFAALKDLLTARTRITRSTEHPGIAETCVDRLCHRVLCDIGCEDLSELRSARRGYQATFAPLPF
jgi:hypothetical protein